VVFVEHNTGTACFPEAPSLHRNGSAGCLSPHALEKNGRFSLVKILMGPGFIEEFLAGSPPADERPSPIVIGASGG